MLQDMQIISNIEKIRKDKEIERIYIKKPFQVTRKYRIQAVLLVPLI